MSFNLNKFDLNFQQKIFFNALNCMYNIRNVLLFQTCVYRRYILLTGVGILDIQQPKVAKDV